MYRDKVGFYQNARAVPAGDLTPPFVSTLEAIDITQTSANISWTLDEYATGYVDYGTTTALGSTTSGEASFDWKNHVQALTGLSPGVTYYYRVRGADEAGHPYQSGIQEFTTLGSTGVTAGFYGQVAFGSSLNNLRVGYGGYRYAYRFKAVESGTITGIRHYWLGTAYSSGYAQGDGGTYRMTLQSVDGNLLPSGTVLGSSTVGYTPSTGAVGVTVDFTSPVSVTAGTRYCIVWENLHASPTTNFGSLDAIWLGGGAHSLGEDHPGASYDDLAICRASYPSGAWADTGWYSGANWVPIFNVLYSSGTRQGYGYANSMTDPGNGFGKNVTGSNDRIRVRIIPSAEVTLTTAHIWTKRLSGSDALVVELQDSGGTPIESGSIAAADIPTGTQSAYLTMPSDVSYAFSVSRTLTAGTTYYLEFRVSGGGSSVYRMAGMRRASAYGYSSSTWWADSESYETSNGGSTWVYPASWSGSRTANNIEWGVYFETQE